MVNRAASGALAALLLHQKDGPCHKETNAQPHGKKVLTEQLVSERENVVLGFHSHEEMRMKGPYSSRFLTSGSENLKV